MTCKETKLVRFHISESLLMVQAEILLDLSRRKGGQNDMRVTFARVVKPGSLGGTEAQNLSSNEAD